MLKPREYCRALDAQKLTFERQNTHFFNGYNQVWFSLVERMIIVDASFQISNNEEKHCENDLIVNTPHEEYYEVLK